MIVNLPTPGKILGILFLAVGLFVAVSTFLIKKGLVKNSEGLHVGYFSWGKLIIKNPIKFFNFPAVSILRRRRRERGAYLSIANPEFSTSFNSFEVFSLNEKHTKKNKIISLRSEKNANKALDFILENSKLRRETYSPDFS